MKRKGKMLEWLCMKVGVHQDSMLSPLLVATVENALTDKLVETKQFCLQTI